MVTLNFANVQEKIFQDLAVQSLLPEYKDLFQQWKLGQFIPALRPMAQKALLDLLNQLNGHQISLLEKHWEEPVEIDRLDYSIIRNKEIKLDDIPEDLNLEGEIFLYRDEDTLYISTWR